MRVSTGWAGMVPARGKPMGIWEIWDEQQQKTTAVTSTNNSNNDSNDGMNKQWLTSTNEWMYDNEKKLHDNVVPALFQLLPFSFEVRLACHSGGILVFHQTKETPTTKAKKSLHCLHWKSWAYMRKKESSVGENMLNINWCCYKRTLKTLNYLDRMKKLTWNCQVIKGHARETWIHHTMLMPPSQYITNFFDISA